MRTISLYISLFLLISNAACKKFIQVDAPKTSLVRETVFESNSTAQAAVLGIYFNCMNAIGYRWDLHLGFAADELDAYDGGYNNNKSFVENDLRPSDVQVLAKWEQHYNSIYMCNDVLEGLAASTKVTAPYKTRLAAEARFLRAFSYFYLVNAYGAVPLDTITDYRQNAVRGRTDVKDIYAQIIKDLQLASNDLDEQYLNSLQQPTVERKRVNRFAAKALLARVYLYTGQYPQAETEASAVIEQAALYSDIPVSNFFLKNSKESIWQLGKDMGNTFYPDQYRYSANRPELAALRKSLFDRFAPEDLRRQYWIRVEQAGANSYYLPAKYKEITTTTSIEYMTVLRLGEMYLVRAEARMKQPGKLTGNNSALSDLNHIRGRSGLQDTLIQSEPAMQFAIEEERLRELFTEWGHRWFDLKRTGRANDVLGPIKGAFWQETDQLFPIPSKEILNNPALTDHQNPGYY